MTPITSIIPTPYGDVWTAHDDDMGADTSPIGTGETEAEAIADLAEQLADRAPMDLALAKQRSIIRSA